MPKSSPEIVLVTNGTMNTPQSAVVFECHMDSHPYWFPSPYFETISRRSCLRSQPEVPPPSTFLSNESQIALPMKTGGNSVQPGNFWWEKTVIYEIYPKSFCEHHEVASSSHVGCGNINGIRHKLSTLHSLGIETLWLCPVFASPYLDGGYDVSDYKSINPLFGTLEDMENLIAELHQKKMRLILDLVLNHTSTEHQWFKDSRLKRNGHDDWYIWKKGLPNRPPNNWVSVAGGPAWTFDKERGEWYMHTFATFQPDLNYRHPAVKEAIIEQVSFWIKKGVDGFRLDALKHIFKDAFLQDEPINPENPPNGQPFLYKHLNHLHTTNLPEVHEFLQTLRQHVGEEICLMGECWQDWDSVIPYFGQATQRECHLMLHFGLIGMNNISGQKLIQLVETSEKYKDVTPVWAIGSHDVDRAWSRFGPQKASLATLVLLTLRGVPIIYYGDEIGLKNYQPPTNSSSPALPDARYAFRTPMQFDTSPNSGFTKAPRPWIPLGPDWKTSNVESQTGRMDSTLELHRALIQLRNTHPCLHMGQCKILPTGKGGKTVAYSRIHGTDKITVIINSSASPTTVPLAPLLFPQSHSSASATTTEHVPQVHVLLSSRCVHPKPITLNSPSISLGPWEGIVLTADSADVSNDSAAPQTAVTTNNTKTKPIIHSNTAPPPTKSHSTTTASTTTTTSSKKATAKEDNVHGEPPSSEGVPKPSGFTIEEPHKRKHKKKT
ncbi:alpha amylase, catalytic region [Pelomyxa schiedti]|nr:alpha amylase, catalytic region [Pelomyxa schiedti]